MAGLAVAAAMLTAFAGAGPAFAGASFAVPSAAAASADAEACGPLPAFPPGMANQIMAGRLAIGPFGPILIDPHHDGRINWAQNPYYNPTWLVEFQNGQWIETRLVIRQIPLPGQQAPVSARLARAGCRGRRCSAPRPRW